jgi:TRAP transporter TAXI family solute receptor
LPAAIFRVKVNTLARGQGSALGSGVIKNKKCGRFIYTACAAVVFILFLSGHAAAQSTPPIAPATLTLATGDEKGVYYRLGQEIAAVLQPYGINIRVIPSSGSLDNLAMLASNRVQLCLAQADAASDLATGFGSFGQRCSDIRALAPLYTETVHILIRNPIRMRRLQDLQGKRISVGPSGGGTELNARALLEAAGIAGEDAVISNLGLDAAAQALSRRELDVAFMTMGYPVPVIQELMQSRCVSLFEPDRETLSRLIDSHPEFVLTSIPAGTYANQDGSIDTLGVPALLLTCVDLDSNSAERITRAVSAHLPEILKRLNIKTDRKNAADRLARIQIPVHPGAEKYYAEQSKSLKSRATRLLNRTGIPLLLTLMLIWAYKKSASLSHFFGRHPAARALALLFCVLFAGSVVMYFAERRLNDNYATYPAAVWSTFVNWISFGQKEPVSAAGRINSTAMTLLGMGGISWLVGEIAAFLIRQRLKETNMCKAMKDHFVIINWNEFGPAVIEKLQAMKKELGSKASVVVVAPSATNTPSDAVRLPTDPLSAALVEDSNMRLARSVIILSDAGLEPSVADARNVLIVMNLARLLPKNADGHPHIAVEIHDAKTAPLLSGGTLSVEVVSVQSVATDLIVQVAGTPGLTGIYEDLLTNGENSSEIYSTPISTSWEGKTFADLCEACAALRNDNINVLPLAVSRGGKMYVNPASSEIGKLMPGDILFAVCDELKNLRRFGAVG